VERMLSGRKRKAGGTPERHAVNEERVAGEGQRSSGGSRVKNRNQEMKEQAPQLQNETWAIIATEKPLRLKNMGNVSYGKERGPERVWGRKEKIQKSRERTEQKLGGREQKEPGPHGGEGERS